MLRNVFLDGRSPHRSLQNVEVAEFLIKAKVNRWQLWGDVPTEEYKGGSSDTD